MQTSLPSTPSSKFCLRAFDCRSEDAVRSTLAAFETLVFTYFLKNACRLIAELSAGSKRRDEFDRALFLENLQWVARGRAVARHIGLSWAQFDNSTPEEALFAARQNVARVDAMITDRLEGRLANNRAFDVAVQALLWTPSTAAGRSRSQWPRHWPTWTMTGISERIYFMLVGFGCPGSVDVRTYLEDAGKTVRHCAGLELQGLVALRHPHPASGRASLQPANRSPNTAGVARNLRQGQHDQPLHSTGWRAWHQKTTRRFRAAGLVLLSCGHGVAWRTISSPSYWTPRRTRR